MGTVPWRWAVPAPAPFPVTPSVHLRGFVRRGCVSGVELGMGGGGCLAREQQWLFGGNVLGPRVQGVTTAGDVITGTLAGSVLNVSFVQRGTVQTKVFASV